MAWLIGFLGYAVAIIIVTVQWERLTRRLKNMGERLATVERLDFVDERLSRLEDASHIRKA
jgi:hypothetical protein